MSIRPLPHDPAAEEAVLGSVLSSPDLVPEIAALVAVEDFYSEDVRAAYAAAIAIDDRGETPDVVAVVGELRRAGSEIDPLRIAQAAESVIVASSGPTHARTVARLSARRRLIRLLGEASEQAWGTDADPTALASTLSLDLVEAAPESRSLVRMQDLVSPTLEALEARASGRVEGGVRTGFVGLDRLLGGLAPGRAYLVASRPGVGKSTLATNIARVVAATVPVLMFSLEMSADEIALRLLCAEAGVQSAVEHTPGLEDWRRLLAAAETLEGIDLSIDDRAPLRLADLRSMARRTRGVGLVVVDYIQLMSAGGRRVNRQEEVAEISRGLKLLAKEIGAPVLACCQLNRDPDKRADRRPQLSDLRESGALEQDADVVVLLHRDSSDPRKAEAIVAKHRNGPTGIVRLIFERETTRFSNSAW